MRMDSFDYATAEACLYEGMRWGNSKGNVEPEREGKACIDPEKTHMNVTYVKDCLRPKAKYKDKKYAEENRGVSIAEYHNSRTSSQSHAIMKGEKLSQAIGLIGTLPRDNPWVKKAELTEEEYDYLLEHMVEKPQASRIHNKTDEKMERCIKEKLREVIATPEDRVKINAFLITTMFAWLEECEISREDVLFWAIHWDETYPHIHVMALPTVEKEYKEDVYYKRVKKDGTRTLLHAAGSKGISYSVERFYADPYIDEKNKVHYPFMEKYHPNVIERMKGYDTESLKGMFKSSEWKKFFEKNLDLEEQIKNTAGGLMNGATKGNGFLPKNFTKDQRMEGVDLANINRALREDNARQNEELNQTTALVEEMQAKQIILSRENASIRESFRELLNTIKAMVKEVVKEAIEEFLPLWKNATLEKRGSVRKEAESSIYGKLTKPVEEMENKVTNFLKSAEEKEADLSLFTITPQRYGFAIGQIRRASKGTKYEDLFAGITKETVEDCPAMKLCLDDWFGKEKYKGILATMTVEEEINFMKNSNRAERAIKYLDDCVESGLIDVEEEEDLER